MVIIDENVHRIGNTTIYLKTNLKSQTENELRESINHVIARIICLCESDENRSYHVI